MNEQKPELTLSYGLLTLPIVSCNFHDTEGGNPLQTAVMDISAHVLKETVMKLNAVVKAMCEKQGIAFNMLDDETIRLTTLQVASKPLTEERFTGVIGEHGKPIIDADALETREAGRSTDN